MVTDSLCFNTGDLNAAISLVVAEMARKVLGGVRYASLPGAVDTVRNVAFEKHELTAGDFIRTVVESKNVEARSNRHIEQKIVCNVNSVLQRVANLAELGFREVADDSVQKEHEVVSHCEGS